MNQALSRPLRMRHLLLLVPLLLASAPPASTAPAPSALPYLKTFRIEFESPPVVAGSEAYFTVTAIDNSDNVFSGYVGTMNVEVSDAPATAEVDPPSRLFLGVENGVGRFRARWSRAIRQRVIVRDVLASVTMEHELTVLPGEATRLDLQLPSMLQAGVGFPVTVTAYDAYNNVASGFTGTVRFEPAGQAMNLPPTYTFLPGNNGTKKFENVIISKSGAQGMKVLSATGSSPTESARLFRVAPGPTAKFQFSSPPASTRAGEPVELVVQSVDAFGNLTTYDPAASVQFSSSDGRLRPRGPVPFGSGTLRVTFETAGQHSLTVTDTNGISGLLNSIRVLPGQATAVELSTPGPLAVDACTPAVVQLRAVDAFGNTVPEDVDVTLCGRPSLSLKFEGTNLVDGKEVDVGCVRGKLPLLEPGRVRWSNRAPVSVEFSAQSTLAAIGPARLTWQRGGFRPARSEISFPNADETPPKLRTFTQKLAVLFELRNACDEAVDPPQGQVLSFQSQLPMVVDAPVQRQAEGRFTTSLRLPKCPDTGSDSLMLWPALNGELIPLPSGEKLAAQIRPNCLPPDVQLSVEAKTEGDKAIHGAQVEFEVELTNTGQSVIPEGTLWLETEALTVLQARLDGEELPSFSSKIELAELQPGETRKVKLGGQASVEPDPPVKLTAWYTTREGAELTEKQVLTLEWEELGADVGCGCQTGSLPSQFLPWLALLAAASRSRSRLRRLTRGERIDR